jgi:DNA-binding response OmpR family regulator
MRALVADDDRVTAAMLARTLERWGLDVVVVHNGEDAWTTVETDATIGLAILDWMMPGLDGPEVCRRIRQESTRAHMHVLLITARNSRADIVAGLDAGADDYLTKPFDLEELRARVHVGLRVLALQERLAERVAELETAATNIKQLRGLLPICGYCKRIRGDGNYWEQVEQYIAHHSDAQFSHGICPTCFHNVVEKLDDESLTS